jgi:hypothetical protein
MSNTPFNTNSVFGRDNAGQTPGGIAATTGGSDGDNKMWLPIWSGEVMYAYDQFRMFDSLVDSRTIESGRVMEFPIMGAVDLKSAWGAGEELIGNTNDHASKTVAIQLDARPIATHFELDNVDLMITQWEYRQELARQAGQTMANARDLQIASYLTRAAGESILSGDPRSGTGWNRRLVDAPIYGPETSFSNLADLDDASDRTDGALEVLAAIEDFMVHLQQIDASTDGVTLVTTPRTFHDIRALGVARDSAGLLGGTMPMFGGVADAGGLGAGLAQGMNGLGDTLDYMGCRIVKSNHLLNFNAGTAGSEIGEARYNLNGASNGGDVKALLFQRGGVASLSKTGLKVDTVDDIRRNTTFTVASMLSGTGVLRPELCSVLVGKSHSSQSAGTARQNFAAALGMTAEFVNVS